MITTINEKIEAQTIICNINAMRSNIGLDAHKNIDWIFKNRSLEYLRNEQTEIIQHYNEAAKNGKLFI